MPNPESHDSELRQAILEKECHRIGRLIGSAINDDAPERYGFVLVLYNFGEDGDMSYISSGQREDCVQMLRELLAHLEKKETE